MPPQPQKRMTFQSTLPVWGATNKSGWQFPKALISIHAPRVGSDLTSASSIRTALYFNPRSPCGERHNGIVGAPVEIEAISIHAPRVGSDSGASSGGGLHVDFNPRSPCGERRSADACASDVYGKISIHAPRVGSDPVPAANIFDKIKFQSTLPVWGATSARRALTFRLL